MARLYFTFSVFFQEQFWILKYVGKDFKQVFLAWKKYNNSESDYWIPYFP